MTEDQVHPSQLDKVSNRHSPKEGMPDSAQIKGADDNSRHALVEKQQSLKSFRITGVDAHTGRKQESFRLVDGDAVHQDVRETRGAEKNGNAQPDVVGNRLRTVQLPDGTEWTPPTVNFDLSKFKIDTSFIETVKRQFGKIEDGINPENQLLSWNQNDLKKGSERRNLNPEFVDVGWQMVDLKNDGPKPTNQILQEMDDSSYNCKYYVKTYIEGRLPSDADPSDCRISNKYMEEHGFHKEKLNGPNNLKDGDIVMIKAPVDGKFHLSSIIHVAIVAHDKDGKLVLIQKPDDIHHVQKCSWKDFRDHFRKAVPNLDIPGPDIDVYRR